MKKVPLGISVINSILLAVSAVLLATGLSGLLNLPGSPLNPFLRILGAKWELPKPGIAGGIISIATSIIVFAVALELGRGKMWAFFTTASLFAISAIFGTFNALSGSILSILTALISLSCLLYLVSSPKVKNFLREEKPAEEGFTLEMTL